MFILETVEVFLRIISCLRNLRPTGCEFGFLGNHGCMLLFFEVGIVLEMTFSRENEGLQGAYLRTQLFTSHDISTRQLFGLWRVKEIH